MRKMNALSSARVKDGIKFKERNLAVITSGSKIHAIWIPINAKIIIMPKIKYLIFLKMPVSLFFDFIPHASMIVPSGQTHPQKNLPIINVAPSIIKENRLNTEMSGSILKNAAVCGVSHRR